MLKPSDLGNLSNTGDNGGNVGQITVPASQQPIPSMQGSSICGEYMF